MNLQNKYKSKIRSCCFQVFIVIIFVFASDNHEISLQVH